MVYEIRIYFICVQFSSYEPFIPALRSYHMYIIKAICMSYKKYESYGRRLTICIPLR